MGKPITHLLFMDLETTGTERGLDEVLEAAWILTTTDLEEVTRGSVILPPSGAGLDRLYHNEFVFKMHTENGLLDDLARTFPEASADWAARRQEALEAVDTELCRMLELEGVETHAVEIAGSGVLHFDRPKFIEGHFPKLNRYLAYGSGGDVGVTRRQIQMWAPGWIPDRNEDKPHRAAADVEIHLEDARAYRGAMQRAQLMATVAHAAWHLLDDSGEVFDEPDILHSRIDHDKLSAALDALEESGWDPHPDA